MKTVTAAFQGKISYRKVPHMRGMTQFGLASHMGVGLSTLKDYGQRPEYSAIYGEVDAIMKSWNLDVYSSMKAIAFMALHLGSQCRVSSVVIMPITTRCPINMNT